jgi:hypothetical protein
MAFSASMTVPPNGTRFSRAAQRSGAASAESACWAHILLVTQDD